MGGGGTRRTFFSLGYGVRKGGGVFWDGKLFDRRLKLGSPI